MSSEGLPQISKQKQAHKGEYGLSDNLDPSHIIMFASHAKGPWIETGQKHGFFLMAWPKKEPPAKEKMKACI